MANSQTVLSTPPATEYDERPDSEVFELARESMQSVAERPSQADVGLQDPDRPSGFLEVETDRLHANPLQPRRRFSEESLRELAASLRRSGVLQPIVVRRHKERSEEFEIVAGERRWRAAKLAKLARVPVIVRDLSDSSAFELSLVENVQREDLTPIERAQAYQRLLTDFGYTQQELSSLLGKSRSHICNTLRLANLPRTVQDLVQSGKLSYGHARALLSAENPEALAQSAVGQKLSVRKLEALSKGSENAAAKTAPSGRRDPARATQDPMLSDLLDRKVTVESAADTYAVTVHCRSVEDLYDFIGKLKSSWGQPRPLDNRPGNGASVADAKTHVKRNTDAYGPEPEPMSATDLAKLAQELGAGRP